MTEITAQGESTRHYAAERATITISSLTEEDTSLPLGFGSSETNGQRAHRRATEITRSLVESGDATWEHHDPVSTYTRIIAIETPKGEEPRSEKRTFSRTRSLVKLSNLSVVSRVVTSLQEEGFEAYVSWNLTEVSRKEYESRARRRAVEKSRERASEYADAIGKSVFRVLSISDVVPAEPLFSKARSAVAGGAGGAPEITIPEIAVSASIVGVFDAE